VGVKFLLLNFTARLILVIGVIFNASVADSKSDYVDQPSTALMNENETLKLVKQLEESIGDLSALPDILEQLEGVRNSAYKTSKRLIDIRLLLILIFISNIVIILVQVNRRPVNDDNSAQTIIEKTLAHMMSNRVFFRLMLILFIFLSLISLILLFFLL